jgi:hypothetical protein
MLLKNKEFYSITELYTKIKEVFSFQKLILSKKINDLFIKFLEMGILKYLQNEVHEKI